MISQDVPPPRRKSCNACVKAKRRCDLLSPQCTRCFQKDIKCVYRGQPPGRRHTPQMSAASSALARGTTTATTINTLVGSSPYTLNVPEFDFHATSYEMPTDPNTDLGFMEFMPAFPVPPYPEDYPTFGSTPSGDFSMGIYTSEDYEHIDDICDKFDSDQLNDDTSRVACAVAAIRNWHRSMAFAFSTPFLHQKLYSHQQPNQIAHAFTSCLMYATKTTQTENVIIPMIEENASALITEHSTDDISPTIALARVQALLLYQSIRRAHYVDRDLPILERWTGYLANLRDKSRSNLSMVVPSGPNSWDSWMFWECVSRTILAASFFINVHCLIARGEHPLGEWTKPHLWTASKRLWNAGSSEEFFALWQRRKPLMVCNVFINNLMDEGDGDEIDAFASMLIVPCVGLAATKKWIEDTRGRFSDALDEPNSD